MRPLCRKASENLGEGTHTVTSREENPQTSTNDVEDTVEYVKRDHIAFVFYDFETRQDARRKENVRIHVPILCVAQQICEACAGIEVMSLRYHWCGMREFIFSSDPIKEFVDFATRTSKYFKKSSVSRTMLKHLTLSSF